MTDPRQPQPDELPRHAASDPLLSIDGQSPGAGSMPWKFALAALAVVLLIGMVAALWIGAHAGRKGQIEKAPSQIEQRA